MHIKPYVVLGLATVCAGTSVGILVTSADPYTAPPLVIVLFWASLFLAVWGFFCTGLLLARQTLTQAVWAGFIFALAILVALILLRHGMITKLLLTGILLGTIALLYGVRRLNATR